MKRRRRVKKMQPKADVGSLAALLRTLAGGNEIRVRRPRYCLGNASCQGLLSKQRT